MRRVLLLLAIAGCGSAIEPTGTDAGTIPIGGQDAAIAGALRSVEVGTGTERYMPVARDQVLPIELGSQGGGRNMGYHISGGVRVKGFKPTGVYVLYTISKADTGAELARTDRRDRTFQPEGDGYVFFGMAPRLSDCCAAVNARLKLHVEITDGDGITGSDEEEVIGGPACNDAAGNSLCH